MKKTYIAPELELTKMDANDIIATSFEVLHNYEGQDFILGREATGDFEDFVDF